MELSESVMEGLKVAASSSLSDQLFGFLLSHAADVSTSSLDDGKSKPSTRHDSCTCYAYQVLEIRFNT